jgi:hypothetical protein
MERRITLLLPLLTLLLCAVSTGHAHEIEPLRTVIVQVESDRIDIMVLFEEPPGPRAGLLLARYDLDQNGQLEGFEAELAGREMLPRMLSGMQFEVVGERPATGEPEIKFQVTPTRGITAAAFVSYELPAMPADATRTIVVRNFPVSHAMSAEVLIRAGSDLQIISSSVPHAGGLVTQPATLNPGGTMTAEIAHVDSPQEKLSGR